MTPLGLLALASAAFVGTHFLMSHPLRAGMIGALGERGFALAYTVVSLLLFGAMIHFYGPAMRQSPGLLWVAGDAWWIVATVLMWLGSVLFVGSFRRNPAFPRPGKPIERIGEAHGVYAITRHPMMWGFALWALVHGIVNPTLANLTLSSAVAILAIAGAAAQDRKKAVLVGDAWRDWAARTNFVPFGRGLALPDAFATIGGTLLWLGASWAHGALRYRPAGAWAYFG